MTEEPTRDALLGMLLAGSDVPCPVCAYNLRGINSTTCPECGASLQLQVGSSDLKLGPWLVSVLALALPLGFVGIWTVFVGAGMVMQMFWQGIGIYATTALLLLFPATITTGYAVALWRLIRRRRKFWARPRSAQKRSALIYALLGPGVLLLIIAVLFLAPGFFLGR